MLLLRGLKVILLFNILNGIPSSKRKEIKVSALAVIHITNGNGNTIVYYKYAVKYILGFLYKVCAI